MKSHHEMINDSFWMSQAFVGCIGPNVSYIWFVIDEDRFHLEISYFHPLEYDAEALDDAIVNFEGGREDMPDLTIKRVYDKPALLSWDRRDQGTYANYLYISSTHYYPLDEDEEAS